MTMFPIYLILIPQIYSVHSFKVNVINMCGWTLNSETKETTYLSDKPEKKIVVGVLLPRHFPHPDDLAFFSRLDSVLPGVVLAPKSCRRCCLAGPGISWWGTRTVTLLQVLYKQWTCSTNTGTALHDPIS
jgi:hypothetical protein